MAKVGDRFKNVGVVLLSTAIFLLGCASGPRVAPDVTSYPRDKMETRPVTMVFTPTYLLGIAASIAGAGASGDHQSQTGWKPTLEWEETVVGDTAEFEFFIVPRDRSEHNEEALLGRVDELGGKRCPEEFALIRSHYFYGTEATIRMYDIYSPALEVVIRCSLVLAKIDDENLFRFNEMSSVFGDYNFFDYSILVAHINYDNFVESFRNFLAENNMPIVEDQATNDGIFLAAGLDPKDRRLVPIDRVTAFIRDHNLGTELTFRLFTYQISEHRRGVMSTEQRGFSYGSRPLDRRIAYDRATIFLGKLFDYLGLAPKT